ncbi:EamA family transporter RarD [Fictibacillus phosphorivorans]|uniref:EamA family transporter RarD n=1 Tax=Fictibacillus phosphorivorans TaxID=1221500 RepID=UPI00203E02C3|nr:EamA family transporter RarD [Fictibacillus phosphorivorans]MCM3719314.1 EamA family transporter RarD [Fictibacillus phosphorivorans]MCM3776935.1 EamA family transporter RarD [Fictibacillus phosphorivorans]
MKTYSEQTKGAWYAATAYLIWGVLPLYWKPLDQAGSGEILAHRIFWSFVLMLAVMFILKRSKDLKRDLKILFSSKKQLFSVFIASILISGNWLMYIWAVNNDHVLEASLGYYINPLVNVILGMAVLKEKLNSWQLVSFVIAACGVFLLTWEYGKFPWIALSLALSFGLYGLAKKRGSFDSLTGLTLETMFVVPAAFAYLVFLQWNGTGTFITAGITTTVLLWGAGVVTALPLVLFALGVKRITMTMTGFLQYIAPTLMLLLGVFLFHETFTGIHLVSFTLIWLALLIFTISKTKWANYLINRKNKNSLSAKI